MEEDERMVQFPCTRNCCLNDDDTCLGCFRSLAEITVWSETDNQQRRVIMRHARQRRDAYLMNQGN